MAFGDITVLDTLKFSELSFSQAAVEVRDGIIAVFFEGDSTPLCVTFSYDINGTLTKLDEQTLTGIATCAIVFSAIKIADGIAAFTYLSSGFPPPYTGSVATVAIAADGTITPAVLDTLQFDDNTYGSSIIHATEDIWVITFPDKGTGNGFIVTVDIDSSGIIGATIEDSLQLAATGSCTGQSAIKVADGIVAIFYAARLGPNILNYVETRGIAVDGTIGAIIDGADTWGVSGNYDMCTFAISGTIYACTYREAFSGYGQVNTFDIAVDGTINSVDIDSFQFEGTDVPIKRTVGGAWGSGIAIFFYPNDQQEDPWGEQGITKTVDIDVSGNIGAAVLDTEIVDSTYADYTYLIKVSNTLYIIVWSDNDVYGQAVSLFINIVTAPTVQTLPATGVV